ncbi:TetR/AcrR family transcriptional regulator [Paenibacillus sp. sgz500958]|uniref:TetR/AcrR family transcriptional regulator n=1 Tax=Paenibacillus sp. sgz500958 TaxID=3242475 RepID=UPI0036D424CA
MISEKKKGSRTYDAARSKEMILDAAEEQFAELGYSAARIDAIAKAAGYNKSLIYQYFGDKLGLYTEVVKRADQVGDQVTGQAIAGIMKEDSLVTNPDTFRRFLETNIRELYQFLLDHPRYRKILFWEAAEEWKTWNQITYRPDDFTQLVEIAKAAKENGILRKDIDPVMLPLLLMNITTSTIQSFSRYKPMLDPEGALEDREHMTSQLTNFMIHGVMEQSLL